MRRFPDDFASLLSPRGRQHLQELERSRRNPATEHVQLFAGWITRVKGDACARLLDRHLSCHLELEACGIPRSSIAAMRTNYSEVLPKTMNVRSVVLHRPRSLAMQAARRIGLVDLMRSYTLHRIAEAATGLRLRERPGLQVLCYEAGQYSGPHNDHHPESPSTRRGFVDVHVTFANDAVEHQWLVYEKKGHFSEIANVSQMGAIVVSRLPFWHFTTPLVARSGRERSARRWVLLASYLLV